MFELSPDGRWLALVVHDAQSEILLIDVETGVSRRFGPAGFVGNPLWAPDGRTLLYVGVADGRLAIYAGSPLDQGNTVRVIYTAPADVQRVRLHSANRERNRVLFTAADANTTGYFQLDPAGTSAAESIVPAGGGFLQFSPDGRWLALTGHRTGRSEVYVRRFPDGPEIQVTSDGGEEARWSPRGDALYYRYGDVWYVVALSLEPAPAIGYPRELFRGPYVNIGGFSHTHDPNTDRFLVLLPARVQEPQTRLQVVVNWGAEVKRRLAGVPPMP
jgi:dipeptidyl aminopeptidase/acylaminoacyl peptidase